MNESQWIKTYILPRSGATSGSFLGPGDDASVGPSLATDSPVLTVDAMVEGQHFIGDWIDDETLARRLLRSSISDLSAMGATAVGFLLSVETPCLPGRLGDRFWSSIDEQCEQLGITLLGGNVTASDGPLSLHCTFLGRVQSGHEWRRSGAKSGDLLVVTGDPGMAAQARERIAATAAVARPPAADDRWSSPIPRIEVARALASAAVDGPIVTAAIDLSDGLHLDLERLCQASGQRATIDIDALVETALAPTPDQVLAGGEDYELLMAIDPDSLDRFARIAAQHATRWHPIGVIESAASPAATSDTVQVRLGGTVLKREPRGWDPFDLQQH
ncbi:MAG: thiamine-phosphate kinase [Planctomycetota bacterium]|nr:thiamine-phosphate kinase [Planctomycetota bacterium]